MDEYRSFRELLSPGWEYRLYSHALTILEEGRYLPRMFEFGEIEKRYKSEADGEPNYFLATKAELANALRETFEHFQTRPKNEEKWISFLSNHLCYLDGEIYDVEFEGSIRPPHFVLPFKNLSTEDREWIEENCYVCRTPLSKIVLKLVVNHIVATYNSLPSIAQIIREVEKATAIVRISDAQLRDIRTSIEQWEKEPNGS